MGRKGFEKKVREHYKQYDLPEDMIRYFIKDWYTLFVKMGVSEDIFFEKKTKQTKDIVNFIEKTYMK